MQRVAILIDEKDRRLGTVLVPERTFVIRHNESLFVRSEQGIRLSGGGIAVAFIEQEPVVRNRLMPA
jgi:hypothetical protein